MEGGVGCGMKRLSGSGHIWLKYVSPVWGVIFIRQPDKPEPLRHWIFVIQQDPMAGACPPLPSQSQLINAAIERLLFPSLFLSCFFFFLFSALAAPFIIQSSVGVRKTFLLINLSFRVRKIPLKSTECSVLNYLLINELFVTLSLCSLSFLNLFELLN